MTDREKAIVMAHTGICMLEGEKLDVFYEYLAELYGRPVYTHEWLTLDIKEKSKPDFLKLCREEEPRKGQWIDNGRNYICSVCGESFSHELRYINDGYYGLPPRCPECGAMLEDRDED